jgi:peptidoglycan-associated lipoprotein
MNAKNSGWKLTVCVLTLAVVLVAASGCAKKKKGPGINTTMTDLNSSSNSGPETSTTGDSLPDIDLNKLSFTKAANLGVVYFDYDSHSLRPDALATLKKNADAIRGMTGYAIQIEGHCDERGTQEYNLALSERRALAVRQYLMKLGVSGDRMITISYGEESPADLGHTEAAYAKNRRAEFNKARYTK